MNKKLIYLGVFLLILLVLGVCFISFVKEKPKTSQIANPASVYCEKNNGTLEIRTSDDGSQAGYCIFDDGSECDEWAFYYGKCKR